ncbi:MULTISPECIES: hypothetical protein [Photorhabdus]|nr:hypothetical protein [Photorhabdus khanii]
MHVRFSAQILAIHSVIASITRLIGLAFGYSILVVALKLTDFEE